MRGIVEREAVVKLDILFCFFSFGRDMEDKFKMDELIEQMKLMNERMGKMDERMEKMTQLLGQSMYHQQRTDFTSEYVATKVST